MEQGPKISQEFSRVSLLPGGQGHSSAVYVPGRSGQGRLWLPESQRNVSMVARAKDGDRKEQPGGTSPEEFSCEARSRLYLEKIVLSCRRGTRK